ncbi:MAG TPA: adenylate/guanylate cyclase domain-containing protein [Candidatus Acidoferrum sp.]|nr:adenylate/guanylate cyclase domain-containing protein [Candidatus Acidoferrum sp.]
MADSSGGKQRPRGFAVFIELLQEWWQHRVSFLISLIITLTALGLYVFTYIAEHPSPLLVFMERLELDALDTRFRLRPAKYTPPDARIVIVDIDQKSQEGLGKWPFSRSNFAAMLDILREDGAKVVGFDVTFDKPDQTGVPIRALAQKLEKRKASGHPVDRKLEEEVKALASEYDADKQFGEAIQKFGNVVLGNFFFPKEELQGTDQATLNSYADLVQWYSLAQNSLNPSTGKQDFVNLMQRYEANSILYSATMANIPALLSPDNNNVGTMGFFNVLPDADGVLRRALLVVPFDRSGKISDAELYGSLEVQTIRLYLGVPSEQLTVNYNQTGMVSLQFGDKLEVKPDSIGRLAINYRGPERTYPYYSIVDVVQRKLPAGTFKDKIVLVGASATGIGDLRTPPYGGITYPGVEVHANAIDNMLNHQALTRGAAQELSDIALILFFGIPVGIWMALVAPRWMWFGLSFLVPLVLIDYGAFLRGWWLNFSVPALTLVSNVLLVSLYRALVEEKEKRRIRTAFGQYLSPEVIRRLLRNPQLVEPKKTEITVMFSDIRGFTTISENLDAQDLALFLNQYLSDMTGLVFESQGTLDKYIGDAVMAFWGAPFEVDDHAINGCNSALKMIKRVREMHREWDAQGKPQLDIGIGLNSGVASVGNMGSVLRYGYTALGDTVNLSSRLEGLNKDYGTHIIVNETTYAATQDANFLYRELDLIRVKGKTQPVMIYELIGRAGEESVYGSFADVQLRLEQFARGRTLYRVRRWEEAQRVFQIMIDKWPDDGPARAYWKRCQEYLFDEPPSGWDGVFTMTHK